MEADITLLLQWRAYAHGYSSYRKFRRTDFPYIALAQVGLKDEAEVSAEDGAIVVRVPAQPIRNGWAEASKLLAAGGDDDLVMPEFVNAEDEAIKW